MILVLVAGLSAEAWAKKRVVVEKFTGGGAAVAQGEVEKLVVREHTVVSIAAFNRARRKLAVKRLNESGLARLAAELQADAFVEGAVDRRRGGRTTLVLTVREGKTGAVTDTLDVPLRGARFDAASRADLAAKLQPALAKIAALSSDEPIEITPPGPVATVRPGDDVDTEVAPVTGVKPPPPLPASRDDAAATTALTARDEMSAYRRSRHAPAEVAVGATIVRRDLSFTSADDLTESQKPNGYNGTAVPSVVITGEVYPMSFGAQAGRPIAGLGFGFVFDRVLSLKSRLGAKEYSTTQQRIGADVRYRWNLGKKATMPTVKFMAGFNALSFDIDRGMDDLDLPNFSYKYLDIGAAVRLPLGTPKVAAYLDLRYDQVFGSGEVSENQSYGGGSTIGFEGDAGVELQLIGHLIVKVGARYQRIAFDFDGSGSESVNRDGNSSNQDVGGALDQYISGYLTAGYLF